MISKKSLRKKKKNEAQKKKTTLNEAPLEISIKTNVMSYKKKICIQLVDDEAAIQYMSSNLFYSIISFTRIT